MTERPFWVRLDERGDAPALIQGAETVSHAALARRADAWAEAARACLAPGVERPLALVEAANEIASVVAYLGCLRAGWPVLLAAPGQGAADSPFRRDYRPNLLARAGGWAPEAGAPEPAPMHPDLAVLLSTSGTTGATKLVRLSRRNLAANAASIAAYLGLGPEAAAITALPFHYSYGMSVLHVHLLAGGRLALSDAAVVDEAFWQAARAAGATSLALVPTQFEMLEKAGFSEDWLPGLAYMTQAGGRLDPLVGARFARRAADRGWKLFIMYGQTEAGPRISYVPPGDALDFRDTIGRPVPGGTLALIDGEGREIDGAGVAGELVYRGPNVMLGYARSRAELADPAGPEELRTGDIAERLENGYFRITGRASRFIKLFGLRIGLDEVEAALRAEGHRAHVSGTDAGLVVFLEGGAVPAGLGREIAARYRLPERLVAVAALAAPPLLASGKVDYRALAARAGEILAAAPDGPEAGGLLELLARMPGRGQIDPERSFQDIGGDSLAYLEAELLLSQRLGEAPQGWERMPLGLLERRIAAAGPPPRPAWQPVETHLAGRVLAIFAVLTLHCTSLKVGGGSYFLLMLAGFSLARFQLRPLLGGRAPQAVLAMLLPLLTAYYVLLVPMALKFRPFDPGWFLLVENFRDPIAPGFLVPYWYVSTYSQVVVLACLPFLLPPVRRAVGRRPFLAGLAMLGLLVAAVALSPVAALPYPERHWHPLAALSLAAAGWCVALADSPRRRLAVTAAVVAAAALVWRDVDASVLAFVVLLPAAVTWLPRLRLPRAAARGLLALGPLTLYVYLLHVPVLYLARSYSDRGFDLLAIVATVSVAAAYLARRLYSAAVARLSRGSAAARFEP